MKYIIYKYTSPKKKSYIGYTDNPKRRKNDHKKKELNFKDNTKFANCIRKYGFETLEYEEIDSANTLDEIWKKEKYWIKFYDSVNSGYNITEGGFVPLNQEYEERIVEDIRFLLKDNKLTLQEIADKFNVSISYVSQIKNGKIRGTLVISRMNNNKKGSENPASKLTEESVKQIKNDLAEGVSRIKIQQKYNVSKTLIQLIATGEAWSHVESRYIYKKKEENGNAKLNKDIVSEIKKDLKEGKLMKIQIAKKYDISRATLTQITSGKTWKDVE